MNGTCSAIVNIRNASKFLIVESQENICVLFGRHRNTWENNIKSDVKEVWCREGDSIEPI
jgi:hypothetical protein